MRAKGCLVQEQQWLRTQRLAFMPERINYDAMHKAVVLVGHRSANGAVHTSVGRSPTTRAISTSPSTIQGLKARTITAPFSCVLCVSWLMQCPSSPLSLNSHRDESMGIVVWSAGEICGASGKCHATQRIWKGATDGLVGCNHEKRGIRERGFADDAIWGQTRNWLGTPQVTPLA